MYWKTYHPVSNLPFLSKILEKVILHKLLAHLQENNLCNPFQSAYRTRNSTETALLHIVNDLLNTMDEDKISVLLFLDLYNAITGSAPSYLSELLHIYSPSRSLSSLSDTHMLKIQRFNRKTHGFRTFSHFGPHIWNNLPQDIRHYATLSSFKSQLKTFLFSEYFS